MRQYDDEEIKLTTRMATSHENKYENHKSIRTHAHARKVTTTARVGVYAHDAVANCRNCLNKSQAASKLQTAVAAAFYHDLLRRLGQ